MPGTSARDADAITTCRPGPGRTWTGCRIRSMRERASAVTSSARDHPGARLLLGKCDYCDFVELFDGSPPFRGRHPDAFVAELEHLVNAYARTT